jgi:hypothetical protein
VEAIRALMVAKRSARAPGPEAPLRIHVSIPPRVDVLPARKGTPGLQFLDRFGRTVP